MGTHTIELKLQSIQQLYNSMDPSPFHERDLDHDAENFIESWAQESPRGADIRLIIHLPVQPAEPDESIATSIHNYYRYKAELNRNDLHRMLREGWSSLIIGIAFLAVCTLGGQAIAHRPGEMMRVIGEGLTIVGWVAMWRPLEIYLYRWWPILALGRTYRKLSKAPVSIEAGNR
jgi:hypothetical protein